MYEPLESTDGSPDISVEDNVLHEEIYTKAVKAIGMLSPINGTELLAGDVPLDEATFPDANFRAVLQTYDNDGSGGLSSSELRKIQKLDCSGKGIKSLEGMEKLNRLQILDCSNNQLTNLDVGQSIYLLELDCSGNNMETLNVSNAIRLQELVCSNNQLTNLDVSGNTKLDAYIAIITGWPI